jgi:hypothetical protein
MDGLAMDKSAGREFRRGSYRQRKFDRQGERRASGYEDDGDGGQREAVANRGEWYRLWMRQGICGGLITKSANRNHGAEKQPVGYLRFGAPSPRRGYIGGSHKKAQTSHTPFGVQPSG